MPPSGTGRGDGRSDSTFLVAVIGDEDTVTGFLLAGVGQNDGNREPNYFVVDPKNTSDSEIERVFLSYTARNDIAIILINQYVAHRIRPAITAFKRPHPAVLEIPSKEHPYDPSKDAILRRVKKMLGSQD